MPAEPTPPTSNDTVAKPHVTKPNTAKPRHDAAGWALSGVTCVVLAIGVLVIRSTLPQSDDPSANLVTIEPDATLEEDLISIDDPRETRPNEYITLEPSAQEPRSLPPTATEDPSNDEDHRLDETPPAPPLTVRREPQATQLKR